MLTILVECAKVAGKISGIILHLVDDDLYILQYADDTVLFIGHDLDKARNLNLHLCTFEKLSGLKINNLHKIELFFFREAANSSFAYADIFGSCFSQSPIRYLSIPIHYWRLMIIEWKYVK